MDLKKEVVKRGVLLAVIVAIILVNFASADLVFNSQSNNLVFNTSSLNRMVIGSDGNLLFYNNFTILDNLTVGAGTLYVDSSAGRVAIGDTDPDALLEIKQAGAGNYGLNVSGLLYVNDTNVGIGTTGPSSLLHVANNLGGGSVAIAKIFLYVFKCLK